MKYQDFQELLVNEEDGVLFITMNRPQKRNAMNGRLVHELSTIFLTIRDQKSIRAVVLKGANGNFCAGGDISELDYKSYTDPKNVEKVIWEFNRSFGQLITQINSAPQVVITVLEGVVLGGGLGLACVSDVAIADVNVKIGMPETGLGVIPAQIIPFVVARTGLGHARRLALLGEWVAGTEAKELGIAHYITHSKDQAEKTLKHVLKKVAHTAPNANSFTKKLLLQVGVTDHETLLDQAASCFSKSLISEEGMEGTAAFLEKRPPNWVGKKWVA